jgi:hypothetical protein
VGSGRAVRLVAGLSVLGLVGCNAILGIEELEYDPTAPGNDLRAVVLSQSESMTVQAGVAVSCGDPDPQKQFHDDNSFFRVFDLATLDLGATLYVTKVRIGVETATAPSGQQPATVRLHELSGELLSENLAPIAAIDVSIADQELTLIDVPIEAAVPTGGTLAVEYMTPNGQAAGNKLFVGTNSLGQTAPTYFRAASCGNSQPANLADIGFPEVHLVLEVVGMTE